MSNDRPRLAAVPGLAKVPGPPRRTTSPPTEDAAARLVHDATSPGQPGDTAVTVPVPLELEQRQGTSPAGPTPPKPRTSQRSTGAVRDIGFTTPLSVRTKLRKAASKPDTTKAGVVLAAVEATADRLVELVDAEHARPPAPGALFPDPTMTLRVAGEPRVPESLRLSARNLEVLDTLVAQSGAADRSQLLTAALRAHLQAAP